MAFSWRRHGRGEDAAWDAEAKALTFRAYLAGFLLGLTLVFPAGQAGAEPAGAEPAVLPPVLEMTASWFQRSLDLRLWLTQPVAFRAFTLDAPPRLVLDLLTPDLAFLDTGAVPRPRSVTGMRAGHLPGGGSRLVLDLGAPLALRAAAFSGARLDLSLVAVSRDVFRDRSGAPPGVWAGGSGGAIPAGRGLTVAVDAGHGGADPGAVAAGVLEKDVVLAFAEVLARRLRADGIEVRMIRDADVFLPLAERVRRAVDTHADLFLSLHSNGVADPDAAGAIAFTRSDRGSSAAADARAALENAVDATAGMAPAALDPAVFAGLSAHSRRAADRRAEAAAEAIIAALRAAGTATSPYPRQSAAFAVLAAPGLPSVLLELGFLSNPADRANLLSPAWRLRAAEAVRRGIAAWAEAGLP